jgi:hypothetical protein
MHSARLVALALGARASTSRSAFKLMAGVRSSFPAEPSERPIDRRGVAGMNVTLAATPLHTRRGVDGER